MKTFSCRAECQHDVDEFLFIIECKRLDIKIVAVEPVMDNGVSFGEKGIELKSELSLEEIRDHLRGLADASAMVQTLREVPLAKNNLERDFNIHQKGQAMNEQRMVPANDPDLDDLRTATKACSYSFYKRYLDKEIRLTITRQPKNYRLDPFAFDAVQLPSGNVLFQPYQK